MHLQATLGKFEEYYHRAIFINVPSREIEAGPLYHASTLTQSTGWLAWQLLMHFILKPVGTPHLRLRHCRIQLL
jgi:hypothetical protein